MEWTPLYILIIIIIATILLFAVIKPMFSGAAQFAQTPSFIFMH